MSQLSIFSVLLLTVVIVYTSGQNAFCFRAVCVLIAAIDEHLDSRRHMRHSDSTVTHVLVLASGPATTLRNDLDLLHVQGTSNLRKDGQHGHG